MQLKSAMVSVVRLGCLLLASTRAECRALHTLPALPLRYGREGKTEHCNPNGTLDRRTV